MTVVEFETWVRWYKAKGNKKGERLDAWFGLPLKESNAIRKVTGALLWTEPSGSHDDM